MISLNQTFPLGTSSSSSTMNSEETACYSLILMLMMKIQPIFLLIFGFLANLCSFIVLIQPRLRRRPTFSYLAFLSLSNALLSFIHAFFTLIGVYFGKTLEDLSLFFFCRFLNRFAIDFLTHFSLYTLTAVDLDRVRTVTSKTNIQHRYSRGTNARHSGCSRGFQHVCLIEMIFAVILFVIDLHWLTSYGYIENSPSEDFPDRTMCTITRTDSFSSIYVFYLRSILPMIELIFFGILPFLISLLATIIILRHVSIKYAFAHPVSQHLKQSRRRMELHLSILLISLNCVFLLCTTPHNIYNVYLTRLHRQLDHKSESEGEICSIAFTQKSLDLLQQCYFMSTFFLYILTNKRFREEFYRLFTCFLFYFCQKKNSTHHSTVPTNNHHCRSDNQANIIYHSNPMNSNHLLVLSNTIQRSHSTISDMSLGEQISIEQN